MNYNFCIKLNFANQTFIRRQLKIIIDDKNTPEKESTRFPKFRFYSHQLRFRTLT